MLILQMKKLAFSEVTYLVKMSAMTCCGSRFRSITAV